MSLLLDALRQAEKSKAGQNSETELAELEIQQDSGQHSENEDLEKNEFVELDILPEYELEIVNQAVDTSDDIQEPTLSTVETEPEQEINLSTEDAESETVNQHKNADTDHLHQEYDNKLDANANSITEKLQPEISLINNESESIKEESLEVKEEITLDEEVINVLQTSNKSGNKTIIWIAIFFLLGLLAVAGYLYSLTMTPSVIPVEYEDIDANPIDDPLIQGENSVINNNPEIEADNTKSKKVTALLLQSDPAPAIMTRPQKKVVDSSVSQEKPRIKQQPSSRFIVEPDDNSIEYPKKIRIKIKRQQPSMLRDLGFAYTAYTSQNYSKATGLYMQVLGQDRFNQDALLGLGAIAEQYRDIQKAQFYYEKILRLDANHIVAQNALIRLHKSQNPSENESRYRNQLEKFPDSAETYAALANSYAGKGDWKQAQEAYFNAVERNPDSSEYQYNLAVSLDHLSKHEIALDYYQKALQSGKNIQTRFDKAIVVQRIQQLKEK